MMVTIEHVLWLLGNAIKSAMKGKWSDASETIYLIGFHFQYKRGRTK